MLLTWRGAAASLQAAVGPDGKPLLGRISSKVGGLLEELNDMLGAFEGVPAGEGEHCTTALMPVYVPAMMQLLHSLAYVAGGKRGRRGGGVKKQGLRCAVLLYPTLWFVYVDALLLHQFAAYLQMLHLLLHHAPRAYITSGQQHSIRQAFCYMQFGFGAAAVSSRCMCAQDNTC